MTVSSPDSFFPPVRLSALCRSWAMMALMLEVELLRRREWRYVPVPPDLFDGVGLEGLDGRLLVVAEMGIRGGGMESCLTPKLCSGFSPFGWLRLFFEELRFQDKLSFRLMEPIDEGVGGFSGLEAGGDFPTDFVLDLCARGPEGFCTGEPDVELRGSVISPPVFGLFRNVGSMPPLGSEDDRNGDTPNR